MLDKEAIRQSADISIVAEELGIPTKRTSSSRRIQIICPCHNDQHFGSCYIDTKTNTFKCYACGARGDVFKLVQVSNNATFSEAMSFVANTCGGTSHFETHDLLAKDMIRKRMLPIEDQEFLGICNAPIQTEKCLSPKKDSDDDSDIDIEPFYDDITGKFMGYREQATAVGNPLYQLLHDDEESYRALIDDFCQRKIDAIQKFTKFFIAKKSTNPELNMVISTIGENLSDEDVAYAVSELTKRVRDISLKYGNGAVARDNYSPSMDKLIAIANTFWQQEVNAPF